MKRSIYLKLILSIFTLFSLQLFAQEQEVSRVIDPGQFKDIQEYTHSYLRHSAVVKDPIRIIEARIFTKKRLELTFSRSLSEYPLRDADIKMIYDIAEAYIPEKFEKYTLILKCINKDINILSSDYFSNHKDTRFKHKYEEDDNWIEEADQVYKISKGLNDKHIALWHSHGYYWEQDETRWEWQRARLMLTVEDLFTQSFVLPYIAPMLENAGARVIIPRERDTRTEEVIVDEVATGWKKSEYPGFADTKEYYVFGENPFTMGTAFYRETVPYKREVKNISNISSYFWYPDIPESGTYGVYISYQSLENSSKCAEYILNYSGGEKTFIIDQTMGGSTWVYLGHYPFDKGKTGQGLILFNSTPKKHKHVKGSVVSADAARFGGGMGNIARGYEDKVSGYPRFAEASRYYLQWSGLDTSVYSPTGNKSDYIDDYTSRGHWVNSLIEDYNIPIDLSLAIHTDAGVKQSDTIVGTLAMYSSLSYEEESEYINGVSRDIAREFADIVQTQIIKDVEANFDVDWTRRGLWDRRYLETRIPKVPAILVEMLSHQNLADMKLGHDPKFKFVISRAIYKGVLKFLAYSEDEKYVVQPLPVENFSIELDIKDKNNQANAILSWDEVLDPLEKSAKPSHYIVYTRKSDPKDSLTPLNSFDQGILCKDNKLTLALSPGVIYSYKVVAVNKGGHSFPSETLCAYISPENTKKTALIVNAFTRLDAPESFMSFENNMAGFRSDFDAGVQYGYSTSLIGEQYEYNTNIPWRSDDDPGYGASSSEYETKVIAGNTMDYPVLHARALALLGYNVASSSIGAENKNEYTLIDLILGKELDIPENEITNLISKCDNFLISGEYISENNEDFLHSTLLINDMKEWASSEGKVISSLDPSTSFSFYTKPNEAIYFIESPSGFDSALQDGETILEYPDTGISAGVKNQTDDVTIFVLGFPIESLKEQRSINTLFRTILLSTDI